MADKALFTKDEAAYYLGRDSSTFDALVRAGFIRKGYHQAAKRPAGERGHPTWKREWLDDYIDKYVLED